MPVTWGSNTVHPIPGTPAPAPTGATPGFGATPAPAPGIFGTPAAAPSGSLFGNTTSTTSAFGAAPTPAPSIFGTPASSGSFFSGTPAPAPAGTSLFGSTSTSSLFGSPTPAPAPFGTSSIFGSPAPFGQPQQQQQQQQQPQIPAQAALHAHMEAMNRAEAEKIKAELSKLYATYSGTVTPSTSADAKKNFVSIVYNDLNQEQRQLQWLHGMGTGGNQLIPIAPPKPAQVSPDDWNKAVVQNPDPMSYMPIPLVGADALMGRMTWQQDRAKQLAKDAEMIQASHETVRDLFAQGHKRLQDIQRAHGKHRKRLLEVMRKVEVVRCMTQPLQPAELEAKKRLDQANLQVRQVHKLLEELETRSRSVRPQLQHHQHAAMATTEISASDKEQLSEILGQHREELKQISAVVSRDLRDVELMKDRVITQLGGGGGTGAGSGGGGLPGR